MSRTKEFDVDTALRAAVDLFWRQGYEATSVSDLVQHLGIAKASLYATFGAKHDLYVRALDHYVRTTDARVVDELSRPGSPLDAVRDLVLRHTRDVIADQDVRGCLVVNAAVELPGDESVAKRVGRSWDTLEVALTLALTRARAQGELPADRDPRALARTLLAVLQGLRVLGKGPSEPDRLLDAARQALRLLD
ncbi:TetR/AcrR family transcriptional regulator [Umezawaea beigongshangensis]|uniref:TetR/AcrR family transcriptional regulator n=1 Tax=Umezawaea beigongshangensis TaxID=2780383 RepID=UPI0018F2772F|nr:TetR/AcrR family transcriptional regulator [Umezawaea beigongshangensis]